MHPNNCTPLTRHQIFNYLYSLRKLSFFVSVCPFGISFAIVLSMFSLTFSMSGSRHFFEPPSSLDDCLWRTGGFFDVSSLVGCFANGGFFGGSFSLGGSLSLGASFSFVSSFLGVSDGFLPPFSFFSLSDDGWKLNWLNLILSTILKKKIPWLMVYHKVNRQSC